MTGIEAALAEITPKPRKPDEFTVNELLVKVKVTDPSITGTAVRSRLDRMVETGRCEKRPFALNGKRLNLYRVKK